MTKTTQSVQASTVLCGQGETVLVVEDDDRVRRATFARLMDLGYRVLEASDGTAAMGVLSQHPEIEILFSDLVMPGEISGLHLARRVRDLYPNVHIILTSGYSAELLNGEAEELGLQVLRKPYHQAELARVFREALQAR
jgi:CheY-like chemotaxis protein